ncbi:cardiolipin synthase [Aquimarina agarilytica]|uniref:cardiolipin synthase n=1 Tax=Aquimarina agarilytica TaxID=1087449 RepID=UPI00031BA714|nr:cardiolipin synthase [Aquimarina agarilytica]
MFWIIFTIHLIVALPTVVVIILFGVRPTRSFSWLLLVLFFPFVGVILYLFLGINRRKFKFFQLKQTNKRQLYDKNFDSDVNTKSEVIFKAINKQRLASLIEQTTHFKVLAHNNVQILDDAALAYDYIFESISQAQKFIHLQYYIFEEGEVLDRLAQLLIQKIKEGLEVRIIYDAFGSYHAKRSTLKKLKILGASVFPVMPLRYGSFLFTMNYRNHRKAIIIDGKVAFAGGMNISDKYINAEDDLGKWEDMHLKLSGPIVNSLHRVFIKDYFFASNKELLLGDHYLPEQSKKGNTDIQLVASGPDSEQLSVLQQYLMLINIAQKSISITNPYFVPNQSLLQAIKIAALSGVNVRILVPKKTDSRMATYSMFSYFEELLEVGVEIYLLYGRFTHSKVIVVDTEVASVGSGNFDHRSFEHNFETNVLIYNEKIASKLNSIFLEDCQSCEKLDLESFKTRSIKQRLIEGCARFFSPLL